MTQGHAGKNLFFQARTRKSTSAALTQDSRARPEDDAQGQIVALRAERWDRRTAASKLRTVAYAPTTPLRQLTVPDLLVPEGEVESGRERCSLSRREDTTSEGSCVALDTTPTTHATYTEVTVPPESINVAASVIADVSAGIYRSPAGALKELISNAFDADATSVRISTGWPRFRTFTCTDDGKGMTAASFRRIMMHIGGSTKRDAGELSDVHHRPLVGRIGIGLLSIAQVCKHFTVVSSTGDGRKFKAIIDMEPYQAAEARRARLGQTIDSEQGKIKIGTYELEEADEDRGKKYTRIVMERIDEGFRQRLVDLPQKRAGLTPKEFSEGTIENFLGRVETGTVAEHGAYAHLVWDLAVTAPIEYVDDGPIPGDESLREINKKLKGYEFEAFVDGVKLKKPVRLPRPADSKLRHKVYRVAHSAKLQDGRRFSLSGYLYWQQGRVLPRELQGVLVRVRNVAVGNYDPTYLGYPHHEGWKFSQMSGEIYVDDGLDPAINIDRASFRESDEAYIELQAFLFEKLKTGADEGRGIFSDIKKVTTQAREAKKRTHAARRTAAIKAMVGAVPYFDQRPQSNESSAGVAVKKGNIVVDESLISIVPRRHREFFAAVCGLVEHELDTLSAARKRAFLEKLARMFGQF
jgi:hypothetical protein